MVFAVSDILPFHKLIQIVLQALITAIMVDTDDGCG